ncbi:hypothetical protein EJ110_NYTH28469 [Nymphaea thermarum]|nr:hypothetical protein EJ110_NYTH28469 [Nymphaea thermarum]
MKNLYTKTKGKVHPSPSLTTHSSAAASSEAVSVLKVLPAAILALASALVVEDREVLAYLIARSLSATLAQEERRRCRRSQLHRPAFDCGCFDCYISFWTRWDASPNRDLIHDVIDAFEEHLAAAEGGSGKSNRRARGNRRLSGKNRPFWSPPSSDGAPACEEPPAPLEIDALVEEEVGTETDVAHKDFEEVEDAGGCGDDAEDDGVDCRIISAPATGRSLVRKLVPDVMGFFASRLWTV